MVNAGLDRKKIVYIPNFVSKEEFYKIDNKKRYEIRKKYNLSEDDFVVLGAGQVQTRKGVLDFVKVAESMPDVKFVWAGGFSFGAVTDGYKELKEIMDNPPKNVQFIGIIPREEMNGLYNIADTLFVPSYNELFPMTILEALSCETPIVLRDLDLYKDILFEKYLKGSNNKDFTKRIRALKDNKAIYNKAVKNAIEVSNFYSKEHIFKLWDEFYNDLYNESND